MVDTIGFANAVGGVPAYSGRALRQLNAVSLAGATAARPLGARSGVRPGTSTTTVTATPTTWTCGPLAGVADVMVAAESGPYEFAFDAATSGAIDAADGSNPRLDLVYVKITDPEDGSTVPKAERGYLVGQPAAVPVAPAVPAGGVGIANINVPKAGGGAPTVSWVAPWLPLSGPVLFNTGDEMIAAGALLPPGTHGIVGGVEYLLESTGWHAVFPGRGLLASAVMTAASIGVGGSQLDISPLAVQVVLSASRLLRIRVSTEVYSSVAGDNARLVVREGATILQASNLTCVQPNTQVRLACDTPTLTVSAGTHIYNVALARVTGTGTVYAYASPTEISFIEVDDVGAA